MTDNRWNNPEYVRVLQNLTGWQKRAWLDGDWDIAAGQIMVREAGGTISDIGGNDDALKTGHVVCGNEFVHGELVRILKPLG